MPPPPCPDLWTIGPNGPEPDRMLEVESHPGRRGTTTLFAALDVATGEVTWRCRASTSSWRTLSASWVWACGDRRLHRRSPCRS